MSELREFHPDRILEILIRHEVRFILVGVVAAQAHGSPSLTGDLDICYARDPDNLDRLAASLAELSAVPRGLTAASPRMPPLDARTLRAGGLLTLTTRYGDFDILATPEPGFDYQLLRDHAVTTVIHGAPVHIASLSDLIEMKRAAGRPKDRIELEILGALREELDRRN